MYTDNDHMTVDNVTVKDIATYGAQLLFPDGKLLWVPFDVAPASLLRESHAGDVISVLLPVWWLRKEGFDVD